MVTIVAKRLPETFGTKPRLSLGGRFTKNIGGQTVEVCKDTIAIEI